MKQAIVYNSENGEISCVFTVKDESATYKILVADAEPWQLVTSIDVSGENHIAIISE